MASQSCDWQCWYYMQRVQTLGENCRTAVVPVLTVTMATVVTLYLSWNMLIYPSDT